MDYQECYRWTFHELMVAFLELAFAYCLLCISVFIFVASKFLVYLPCSCSGIFGYQNRNLCLHKLLFDWPIKTVLKIHKLVTTSFPFHSSWHHQELEENGAKIHENGDLKICNGRDCCFDKVKLLEEALEEERAGRAALMVELEEERAAAASAADESMAMILRLQSDKACVQMEGKQYERMVEEKLAYDEEEMDILKEILLKREKEKHFLEKELESYKKIDDDDYDGEPVMYDVHVIEDDKKAACRHGDAEDAAPGETGKTNEYKEEEGDEMKLMEDKVKENVSSNSSSLVDLD